MFHAYALMNLQSIIKFSKALSPEQRELVNVKFALAALAIPLDNRISNFEKLSVSYAPQGVLQEENAKLRNELFGIAAMLQVKGVPSRASLVNYLRIKNLHLSQAFP